MRFYIPLDEWSAISKATNYDSDSFVKDVVNTDGSFRHGMISNITSPESQPFLVLWH